MEFYPGQSMSDVVRLVEGRVLSLSIRVRCGRAGRGSIVYPKAVHARYGQLIGLAEGRALSWAVHVRCDEMVGLVEGRVLSRPIRVR